MRVASLLQRLEQNVRHALELERERADLMRDLLAATADEAPRPTVQSRLMVSEQVKAVIKTMMEAGGELRCQEIAERLGISSSTAAYRLRQAVRFGFVINTEYGGIYKVAPTVPAL